MGKNKTERKLEGINALKERFQHLTSETIASRLTNFNKTNEIVIAYKQILKERDIDDYLSIIK